MPPRRGGQENRMRSAPLFVLLVATSFLAACTNQKEPAEQTFAKVESSLAEFHADAETYASEELKDVDADVANMKKNLANKDYGAVIMSAPSVSASISALKETVAQRKADAEQMRAAAQTEWTELSANLPKAVETLQARVDQLTKTRKLPKGLDKAAFDAAKTDFENMKAQWTQASAEYAEGKVAEAVRKARAIKAQSDELMTKLEAKMT
jgi:predicted  nucleic acid-binding Zn-ribbon protein